MLKKLIIIIYIITSFAHLNTKNIGISSIPKCGTFLLVKCIEHLLQEKGTNIDGTHLRKLENITLNKFFYCHLAYSRPFEQKLKYKNYKLFFIYRDPRDQIISHAFWIKKIYPAYKNYSFDKLIEISIHIAKNLYKNYVSWLDSDITCSIKFENLIGSNGGGNELLQKKEINKICKELNIKSKSIKKSCIKNLFGNSPTFREGKIGSWKNYFTNEQKNLCKQLLGKIIIQLGYEKDNLW